MSEKRRIMEFLRTRAARLPIRNDAVRIGRRIRAAREGRGMEIEALARRTGLAEVDLRRWEEGDPVGFDFYALELIGSARARTRSWLFAGVPEPPEESLAFGEALAHERVLAIIGHFDALPSFAARRRLARYLLFAAVTRQRPKPPAHLRHFGE